MDMHGSLAKNLTSAVRSARRLKGRPVHADTLGYWADLINHARGELAAGSDEPILSLILELEKEIADRVA